MIQKYKHAILMLRSGVTVSNDATYVRNILVDLLKQEQWSMRLKSSNPSVTGSVTLMITEVTDVLTTPYYCLELVLQNEPFVLASLIDPNYACKLAALVLTAIHNRTPTIGDVFQMLGHTLTPTE